MKYKASLEWGGRVCRLGEYRTRDVAFSIARRASIVQHNRRGGDAREEVLNGHIIIEHGTERETVSVRYLKECQ